MKTIFLDKANYKLSFWETSIFDVCIWERLYMKQFDTFLLTFRFRFSWTASVFILSTKGQPFALYYCRIALML